MALSDSVLFKVVPPTLQSHLGACILGNIIPADTIASAPALSSKETLYRRSPAWALLDSGIPVLEPLSLQVDFLNRPWL